MPGPTYTTVIERGYTPVNDAIIDFLKPRIIAPYLDIGCNTGWLLSEVPGGIGIDASPLMVVAAQSRGVDARLGDAAVLAFDGGTFTTAVLSCVLEQCADWRAALSEARRVACRVIGINPIPGMSPWGAVGGWVRSVIGEDEMQSLGFATEHIDSQRYYFENK